MTKVALFIRDFELGTRIADSLAARGDECVFPDTESGDSQDAKVVIVDLDEVDQKPMDLVRKLVSESSEMSVVGCAGRVSKGLMDEAKEAGCRWVFPKSSLVRNLSAVVESGG